MDYSLVPSLHCEKKRTMFISHLSSAVQTTPSTPSSDKVVKELKERLLRAKGNPSLEQVQDVNVLCGVLKDFFRSLREPLLTYRMHKTFTQAAGESSYAMSKMTLATCPLRWR